jgi:hypothetical protein
MAVCDSLVTRPDLQAHRFSPLTPRACALNHRA